MKLHQEGDRRRRDAEGTGEKDEKGHDQFAEQGQPDTTLQDPFRQLLKIPGSHMRQTLSFEVVVQGGEA